MNENEHLRSLERVQPDNEFRRGCLRLDMNENIQGLPEKFIESVVADIDAAFLATYPKYKQLIQQLADHNHISPVNICLGNGSDGVIKYIFEAYISSGDRVLLTNPTFAMFHVYCQMFGADRIAVDYNEDLTFPEDRFIKTLSEGVKMAVVVNPNNPCGTVIAPERMRNVVEAAQKNDVLLIIDEAYYYFYPKTFIQYVLEYPNVIVLRTFSKLCALSAGRVGYAASSEAIIHNLEKVKPTYDVNGFGVLFANRLLDQPQHIDDMIQEFREARDHLYARLEEAAIKFQPSSANFVLIDVGDQVEAIMHGLKQEKILVGGGFSQPNLKNYIRVTIASKNMMDFFMEKFLKVSKGVVHE